jgi:hypothetical protein
MSTKAGDPFRAARRTGMWSDVWEVHRSGLTKARKKVPRTLFRDILEKAVKLAYSRYPCTPSYIWHCMTVVALDLPSSSTRTRQGGQISAYRFCGVNTWPEYIG